MLPVPDGVTVIVFAACVVSWLAGYLWGIASERVYFRRVLAEARREHEERARRAWVDALRPRS